MRQSLPEELISHAAVDDSWCLVCPEHDLLPRLVDLVEPLGLFGKLLGNVTTYEYSLQVHPHVLHQQPPLENFIGVRQVLRE